MKITKAVITAAGQDQRTLPLQMLIDRDGTEKSVLEIIIEETIRAGIEEICLVVCPGDEGSYKSVAGDHAGRIQFVQQEKSLGYGHAVYCSKSFVGSDPFLHLVGDHLYISRTEQGCAQLLVQFAATQKCAVSAVQATRENLLPYYGVIGGQRIAGSSGQYKVDTVTEKPTPTEAEQRLIIPGLRAGHYLCFFGMHVLTPIVFDILEEKINNNKKDNKITLSDALAELPKREQYLALEKDGWRYDVGVKYGLLNAQLALALSGKDRDMVLTKLVELLATREGGSTWGQPVNE
ncbi:UTP--glucose-1-phosphate uridylyltransferase [candidate division KSB1 bacterium]|nr:UTP--glucose-1-phosphate uridylyltransferase [candidate division KSB1 bacterium]MBL7092916.1 UTP--glucose-1-phosphate uridylyltransferase [candidate division KSB1 bacterium]